MFQVTRAVSLTALILKENIPGSEDQLKYNEYTTILNTLVILGVVRQSEVDGIHLLSPTQASFTTQLGVLPLHQPHLSAGSAITSL